MNRILSVLLVVAGCVVLSSATNGPCAPDQFTTEYILIQSTNPSVGEQGILSIDFAQHSVVANVSGFVTSSTHEPETFAGLFLYTNNTAYWVDASTGNCHGTLSPAESFITQCFPSGGSYASHYVGAIQATQYTYLGPANATVYTYSQDNYPITLQSIVYDNENGISNSTSISYFNSRNSIPQNAFEIPPECQNVVMVHHHEMPAHVKKFFASKQ